MRKTKETRISLIEHVEIMLTMRMESKKIDLKSPLPISRVRYLTDTAAISASDLR